MKHKLLAPALILVLALTAPLSFAQFAAPNTGKGLAIGQNQKLLQNTRDSNAGAGNGSELVRTCRIDFSSGAHNMQMNCTTEEIDPGNSHDHNQSPECDYLDCTFDPHGF